MLRGVFHLHEQEAREVMTPIPAVVSVDASARSVMRSSSAGLPVTTGCWWSRTATRTAFAASLTPFDSPAC